MDEIKKDACIEVPRIKVDIHSTFEPEKDETPKVETRIKDGSTIPQQL